VEIRQQTKPGNKADAYPRCGLTTPARLTGFPASTLLPSQASSLGAAKTERIRASGPIQTRNRETRPRETAPIFGQHAYLGGLGWIALDLSGSVPNDPSHDWAARTDGGLARDTTGQQNGCSQLKLQYLVESRVESKQSRHSLSWFTLAAPRPK
jgi:hypothetical protein